LPRVIRRVVSTITCLAAVLPAMAQDDGGGTFGVPLGRRAPEAPASALIAPRGAGGAAFANGGFEILSGAHPAQWTVAGTPTTGLDGGNRFARIGSAHQYRQSIAVPFALRHVAVSARFRTEIFGFPAFDVFGAAPGESVFQRASWGLAEDAGWARLYGTFMFAEPSADFLVVPRTKSGGSWLDMDDIVAFDEGIANGDFEGVVDAEMFPAWAFAGGGATVADATLQPSGATALRLPVGASASIVAAARDAGQSYFVVGRARAESGTATLRLSLRDANPLVVAADHFTTDIAVASTAAPFVVETGRTPATCPAENIALEHAGGAPIRVDVASRGFVHVWPPTYYSGPTSVNPELMLVAAWPGEMAAASVAIRNAANAVVDTVPLSVAQGTATGTWSGDGFAAGAYSAEFSLAGESGATATLSRAFEHRVDSGAAAEAPPFATDRFERGAWVWLFATPATQEAVQPILAQAKADGFTFAVVFATSAHWPAVRAACEAIDLRFVASNIASNAAIRGNPPGIAPLDFASYSDAATDEFADLLGSPKLIGTYITDEPAALWEQCNAGAAVRCVAAVPSLGTPFLTLTPDASADSAAWDRVRPPVHWTDYYPFYDGSPDFAGRMHLLSDHLREQVAMANDRDRAYWLVAGAFGSVDGSTPGNDATVRATFGLCVAHGVRGIVPFFYTQINALEGMRTSALELLPDAGEWIAGNLRLATIENDLVEFSNHEPVGANLQTFVVTTMRDPADDLLLCAVNLDCRRRARLSISFDGPDATLVEATTGETLSTTSGAIDAWFAPGDWRLWRIDGAAPATFSETVDPRLPPALALPVNGDVDVPAGVVHDLEFSSNGGALLVASGGVVYRLFPDGQILNATGAFGATNVEWLSTSTALFCSPTTGAWGIQYPSAAVTESWLRRVGSASWAVAAGGGAAWIGNDFLGVRRLASAGGLAFSSTNVGGPSGFPLVGVGTVAGGAILAPELFGGFHRGTANGSGGVDFSFIAGSPIVARGSISPNKLIAASARQRRGFSLTKLDAAGNAVATVDYPPPSGEAIVVVDMIANDLLAVGELDGDIEFHGVASDLSLALRGRWRPDPRPVGALTSMDYVGGLFAAGFADGRVVVVDASQLPATFPPPDLFVID